MPRKKIHDVDIQGRYLQVLWGSDHVQVSTYAPYGPHLQVHSDPVHLDLPGIRRLIKALRQARRQAKRGV